MPTHYRKFLVATTFFILFFCWHTTSAQDKEIERDEPDEINALDSKTEHLENKPASFTDIHPLNRESTLKKRTSRHEYETLESTEIMDSRYNLHLPKSNERRLELDTLPFENPRTTSNPPRLSSDNYSVENDVDDPSTDEKIDQGFQWRAAIGQSLMFLAVQHGYAFTQPKTREAIKGKFWKDYSKSVKSLHGWDDGGRFFTNYIAHPMQGSLTGFIYVQNDPKAKKTKVWCIE